MALRRAYVVCAQLRGSPLLIPPLHAGGSRCRLIVGVVSGIKKRTAPDVRRMLPDTSLFPVATPDSHESRVTVTVPRRRLDLGALFSVVSLSQRFCGMTINALVAGDGLFSLY